MEAFREAIVAGEVPHAAYFVDSRVESFSEGPGLDKLGLAEPLDEVEQLFEQRRALEFVLAALAQQAVLVLLHLKNGQEQRLGGEQDLQFGFSLGIEPAKRERRRFSRGGSRRSGARAGGPS